MNVLKIDTNKYTVKQVQSIFNHVKEKLGDDLICLPAHVSLLVDCDIDTLIQIRRQIDFVIWQKRHADDEHS